MLTDVGHRRMPDCFLPLPPAGAHPFPPEAGKGEYALSLIRGTLKWFPD